MLKIRLQRVGKKGKAHYKLVVMEHTLKTTGKYLDLLGWYNPHTKELKIDEDKLKQHLANGAQMSPTVNNLLVSKNIIDSKKVTSWKPKKKEASEEEAEGSAPAEGEAPAEEAPKEEAPAEETPKEEAPAEPENKEAEQPAS